jgi:hypothetical protein
MLDAKSQKGKKSPGPTVVMVHVSIANKVCSVVFCVSGSKEKRKTRTQCRDACEHR